MDFGNGLEYWGFGRTSLPFKILFWLKNVKTLRQNPFNLMSWDKNVLAHLHNKLVEQFHINVIIILDKDHPVGSIEKQINLFSK